MYVRNPDEATTGNMRNTLRCPINFSRLMLLAKVPKQNHGLNNILSVTLGMLVVFMVS